MATTVYQIVTDRILSLLESGVCPWRRPWKSTLAQNLVSGKPYQGVNSLLLNSLAHESPYWVTFKQAKDLGGSVRKGEHGFPIVFWKWLEKKEDETTKRFPLLRYFTVFNAGQCDGLKLPEAGPAVREILPCESVLSSYKGGPPVNLDGGDRAFYRPATDSVHMPRRDTFESPEAWYSVLFHEMVHSTGHEARLARFEAADQFSFASSSYSKEELVAEMGAAFLCGETGVSQDLPNTAAYLESWMRVLRQPGSAKLIVEAAGKAQKAADLILGRSRAPEASSDEARAA